MHGALIEAEILTSPLPHVFAQLGPGFWVLVLYPWVCQHLPRGLEMFLCVSGTSKKYLVHGALIEAEILTSPPQCICSTWPGFWVLVLYPWVCQHLPSGLEMFLCVSGTSKEIFGAWTLIEAEILTSPLPMYLLNLAHFGYWYSACRCVNTSQVI